MKTGWERDSGPALSNPEFGGIRNVQNEIAHDPLDGGAMNASTAQQLLCLVARAGSHKPWVWAKICEPTKCC